MNACCHTSFFLNYPIEEVLRRLGDAGYKGVEISALLECGTYTPEFLHPKRIDQFRRSVEIAGLEIVSYDCELLPPLGRNLASPSKTVRERTKDYIISSISAASNIGVRFVVISAGMTMYGVMKEKA
jgi:sugar phosphate isomerase/epimerase